MLVAGLRGGGGKTLVALGLVAAWRNTGRKVAPFKKGPDYIDAAWLTAAASTPCRNLDLFLMSRQGVLRSMAAAVDSSDVAVIEGNRGLFDGMNAEGSYSTGELAKLLRTPVVLTVDCTKTTRTVAAMILGCMRLDPEVPLRGVVLNRIAGSRHETVIRDAIEKDCGIPIVGVVPRLRHRMFPERHLGLVPPTEHSEQTDAIHRVGEVGERYLDLDALWSLAQEAPMLESEVGPDAEGDTPKPNIVKIGVFRDAAFQFYYPENLEALAREGAELIEISPLTETRMPAVDALYIGGGFPETLASALADNKSFLESVRHKAEKGLPIYAECGGAVYLGEKLLYDSNEYSMAAVLPVKYGFGKKPQGHGYVQVDTVNDNPFFPIGESLRGHEFHYTFMQSSSVEKLDFAFRVTRGVGFDGERDGLCRHNVLASYTHVHALGTESWAPGLVGAAVRFRSANESVSDFAGTD